MGKIRGTWLGAILAVAVTVPVQAQSVSRLEEAIRRADRHGFANRRAEGDRQGVAGDGMRAWQGILPSVRAEAGWLRTTDPLHAFGLTLRQRQVTPAAFDPARLNAPEPTTGIGSALVLEQPLLNLDAWVGRGAASSAARAARAGSEWAATSTRVQVIQAWFGGVLAAERVATLEAAVEAAESHVRQAFLMLEQGMVTRADLLLAQVKAGELQADLLAARGDLALATLRVATAIGTPGDTGIALPAALPSRPALEQMLAALDAMSGDSESRADVVAARFGADAARRDLQRTRAAMLPRLNGYARYDWNTPDAAFRGPEAWTVGVMASWAPFSGGSELAASRAARGRAESAAAAAEAAGAQAALEEAESGHALAVARARLEIAGHAVAQAEEAHRLVGRSYAGGLATITELLGAAAAETAARMAHSAALYGAIVAAADRQRARGLSLDHLIALGR